jgi:hypothetical protein
VTYQAPINPYSMYANPYTGTVENNLSAYLGGTATLITSEGKAAKDVQEAARLKEVTAQARLDTRRASLDELRYERNNTPGPEDDRRQALRELQSRSLNDPPVAEIHSGQALNILLDHASGLTAGQSKPLDDSVLRHINFSTGRGSTVIFRDGGRLSWPSALQEDSYRTERSRLDVLLPKAIEQARRGAIGTETLNDLNGSAGAVRLSLLRSAGGLNATRYSEASRFLDQLADGIRILTSPDARTMLAIQAEVRGMSTVELVGYMHAKGLHFAAAAAGDECAYVALHHAFVDYLGRIEPGRDSARTAIDGGQKSGATGTNGALARFRY